jgi:ribonuclease HI
MLSQLNYYFPNNQVKYEDLLFGLKILQSMNVKHVQDFSDSLLIVKQLDGEFQCLKGLLNMYLDAYLDIIAYFTKFGI